VVEDPTILSGGRPNHPSGTKPFTPVVEDPTTPSGGRPHHPSQRLRKGVFG